MYKPDLEKMNRKLKSLGSGKYFKLNEGDNKIRLLPPVGKHDDFYLELTQHYGFNSKEGRGKAYACLEAMKGKTCPICKFARKAEAEGEAEIAKKVEARTVYLTNIVDRTDNAIKIWSFNGKMLKSFIGYILDEDYGATVLDPNKGHDFTVNREGQGLRTRYKDPRISPKPRPIGVDGWEDKMFNLNKEVEFMGFKTLVEALEEEYGDWIEEWGLKFKEKAEDKKEDEEDEDDGDGEEDDEEQDEGDDEVRTQKATSRKAKAKGRGEDREDSSKKGPKRSAKRVVEEEDEDDEDDDLDSLDLDEEDDEEEEAPKKKKGKK